MRNIFNLSKVKTIGEKLSSTSNPSTCIPTELPPHPKCTSNSQCCSKYCDVTTGKCLAQCPSWKQKSEGKCSTDDDCCSHFCQTHQWKQACL